jgi:hypothetical protein
MKRLLTAILLIILCTPGKAQFKAFRFAFISDTHIGSPNGSAEEDLRRTVRDINAMSDIAFGCALLHHSRQPRYRLE